MFLRSLTLLSIVLAGVGSSRTVMAQTVLSPQCNLPGTTTLSAPVNSFAAPVTTLSAPLTTFSAPAVLNVPQPIVTSHVLLPNRVQSHRRTVIQVARPSRLRASSRVLSLNNALTLSAAPAQPLVLSSPVTWQTPLAAAETPVIAPQSSNSVQSATTLDAAPATQNVQLRLRVAQVGSANTNSIQSTSGACRCDAETVRRLSEQAAALSRRLDALEKASGASATSSSSSSEQYGGDK